MTGGISQDGLATWRAFLNAHAAVVSRVDGDLAAAGLPPLTWYDVLWAIYRRPEKKLRMGELASEVVLSRTGMTRLVDRIEAAGCLRREPVPGDRRGAYAAITDEGAELLRRMWQIYEPALQRCFLDHLGDEAAATRAALARIATAG